MLSIRRAVLVVAGAVLLAGCEDGRPWGERPERAAQQLELARVYEELAMLNEIYQRRHGFRYLVFVAGRPKREIVPLLERAITVDSDEELRRALDDSIHIAADRLAKLRNEEGSA
jgi:2-oxo-4-hydroxy-4-carboxy--5-ureidoimidazoline (OHCU) decarboxylase